MPFYKREMKETFRCAKSTVAIQEAELVAWLLSEKKEVKHVKRIPVAGGDVQIVVTYMKTMYFPADDED